MEKFNRAVRRHHIARLKRKRQSYWGYGYYQKAMSETVLGKVVQTPQVCSCWGCGNQRHNTAGWTPSIQERRWFEQYREQVEEAERPSDAVNH